MKAKTAKGVLGYQGAVVWMFPGQGTFDVALLRALGRRPENRPFIGLADGLSQRYLGRSLRDVVDGDLEGQFAGDLVDPAMAQLGVYVTALACAQSLRAFGHEPDLVMGHSAGEIAALAVGGRISPEAGAEVICKRSGVLKAHAMGLGGLRLLACGVEEAKDLLTICEKKNLWLAIVNHPEQCVIAGTDDDLKGLCELAEAQGIGHRVVESGVPFHSPLLRPSVLPFEEALGEFDSRAGTIPVYSPLEGGFYGDKPDLRSILPRHFTQPFSFQGAIEFLGSMGATLFVACGSGGLAGMAAKSLLGRFEGRALRVFKKDVDPAASLLAASKALADHGRGGVRVGFTSQDEPIAIVSMGSVLPGADSPDTFWDNLLKGVSGIIDSGERAPELAADFKAEVAPTPDKTYSLLCGSTRDYQLPPGAPSVELEGQGTLSWGQTLLVGAAEQCLTPHWRECLSGGASLCFLGSTADGCESFDEALLASSLGAVIDGLELDEGEKRRLREGISRGLTRRTEDIPDLSPHGAYNRVLSSYIRGGLPIVAVDAACASSHYAIDMGVKALRLRECDQALVGGVFASGHGIGCLFAQFGGLSATGSRPFDATADGVVFGEAAALFVLKRLGDARRDGDVIYGLIHEVATSSDGRSPSAMEPRPAGQILAMERAYHRTGIDPLALDYLEAHATATPRGDQVEVGALKAVFGRDPKEGGWVELGSVKAAVGHTGWVAGAASLIKMLKAFEAKVLPPQPNLQEANPAFELDSAGLHLSTEPSPWAARGPSGYLAGINSFGFGGSNAHMVVQSYDPAVGWLPKGQASSKGEVLSVVGLSCRLPAHGAAAFEPGELDLPRGVMILPDVQDHMDRAQILAIQGASDALGMIDGWRTLHEDIAVVLGVIGKTGRGIDANRRIYRDRTLRQLKSQGAALGEGAPSPQSISALEDALNEGLESGPYSLMGSMPNVIAGRVCNAFNLRGPNMVVDGGGDSLAEALRGALRILKSQGAKVVLAGGLHGYAGPEVEPLVPEGERSRGPGEGVIIFALSTPEEAEAHGFKELARLEITDVDGDASPSESPRGPYLFGAEGGLALLQALEDVRGDDSSTQGTVTLPAQVNRPLLCRVYPAPERVAPNGFAPLPMESLGGAPLFGGSPALHPSNPPEGKGREPRFIVVYGSGEPGAGLPSLEGLSPGSISLDVASPNVLEEAQSLLATKEYGGVLALWRCGGESKEPVEWVAGGPGTPRALLDTLFALAKGAEPALAKGELALMSCVITQGHRDGIHPLSGLFAGFMKSLSRSYPRAPLRAIHSEGGVIQQALSQVMRECQVAVSGTDVSAIYVDNQRHVFALEPLPLAEDGLGIDESSVVVATGGGRGVTAVLMKALQRETGCTLILLGRTAPDAAPGHILEMSDGEFLAYEPEFYREALEADPGLGIPELRRAYGRLQAARELCQTLGDLDAQPGRTEYIALDITDEALVEQCVEEILQDYGAIDLLVHGAGVQVSQRLTQKPLETFQRVVSTKLDGLLALDRACRARGQWPEVHLLTSAFSFFGNDGQSDYGAANEAMNHISAMMNRRPDPRRCSAMAWLGWAGTGMTRGSEYATVLAHRGLRALSRAEGQQLFLQGMRKRGAAPQQVFVASGEAAFYGLDLTPAPRLGPEGEAREAFHWSVRLPEASYLRDHRVRGIPTIPGAFEGEMCAQAALALRPSMVVAEMHNLRPERFIKVREGEPCELRGVCQVLEESADHALISVAIHSDFVHQSGQILESDILHFSATVLLRSPGDALEDCPPGVTPWPDEVQGPIVEDPWLWPSSPVALGGIFDALREITLGEDWRLARFHLDEGEALREIAHFATPALLLDAIGRVALQVPLGGGQVRVSVPVECRRVWVRPGLNDTSIMTLGGGVTFYTRAPEEKGGAIHNEECIAVDGRGRVVLWIQGLRGHPMGVVQKEGPIPGQPEATGWATPAGGVTGATGHWGVTQAFKGAIDSLQTKEVAASFDPDRGILWTELAPRGLPCFSPQVLSDIEGVQGAGERALLAHPEEEIPLRYIVLSSRIPGVFNTGGDLTLFSQLIRQGDVEGLRAYAHRCVDCIHGFNNGFGFPVITIALVEGAALGGGFEVALAGDILIAERGATFALPEVNFNWFPGMGAYSFLRAKLGHALAREMIVGGDVYSAEALYDLGIVDILAEPGEGRGAALAFMDEHASSYNTLLAVQGFNRQFYSPSYEELIGIVDQWVEVALTLGERELQRMEYALRAQEGRFLG